MLHRLAFGLRKKETYEELVNYLLNDQEVIKYPNRYAKQLRESPYLTQLDGEGMGQMELQQENKFKEEQRQNTIRQVASTTTQSASGVRAEMHHRETFSQSTPVGPDATMTANDGSQTDNPTYATASTGSDDPPPPGGAGAVRVDGGSQTSGLPPPEHYVHLHSHGGGPPPPPPDNSRIRISTSDTGTQPDAPMEAASSSGNPPPQPPGFGPASRRKNIDPYEKPTASSSKPVYYNIGDGRRPDQRALSHEQDAEMAQRQDWQSKEDKRAAAKAALRQHLMETDNAPTQVKRSADDASNSVAQQVLELNHAAARARRQSELQARDDEKRMKQAAKAKADADRRELSEAKRVHASSIKEQTAALKRDKSIAKAEIEAQKKQLETHRAEIQMQMQNDKAIQEAMQQDKKIKKPSPSPDRYRYVTSKAKAQPPKHRSFSEETAPYPVKGSSRSRSRAKSIILPTHEEAAAPPKLPRGRPKKISEEPKVAPLSRSRGRPPTRGVVA